MPDKMSNDDVILQLKSKIEEKKSLLKASEKFSPVTNCSLELDGQRYNLNVITKEQIVYLMVKVNTLLTSAKELGFDKEFEVGGFILSEWMQDLKSRMAIVNRKSEQSKLAVMESKLESLLSNDKKIELELQEIAKSLL